MTAKTSQSGMYDTLRAITSAHCEATSLTGVWQELGSLQPRMLNFLENHDEQRIASPEFAGSPEAGYAALSFFGLPAACDLTFTATVSPKDCHIVKL